MNYIHLIISVIFILVSFYNLRQQVLIDDKEFIKGMIPHHSMSVLMADKIVNRTNNPHVRQLAANIIKTQAHEINQMKYLEKQQ